jgi:membrane protein CcdC involved in cytochrome C biogenesis
MPLPHLEAFALVGGLVMFTIITRHRMKEAARPLSPRKIILPPLFMSTGAFMYLAPIFRPTSTQGALAIGAGAFFSLFLIATTRLERRDDQVFLKPSRAFIVVLLALFAVRFVLKTWLRHSIGFEQLGGVFFLLAFTMIVAWRLAMFLSYRRLKLAPVPVAAGDPL